VEEWERVLGCPYCRGALELYDPKTILCSGCNRPFGYQDAIPVLLRHETIAQFAHFERQYREARLEEGWGPLDPAQALDLPCRQPNGHPVLYWQVRRQSFRALMRRLANEGPSPEAGPVADLGAGIGWLSFRLAQAGYRVLAIDASLDKDFGLGAAAIYHSHRAFLRVQGDIEYPPLQRGTLSLALFNASLHYAQDLEATLYRTAQSLRPGGYVIVLDVPIARQPRPGTGKGDRHLGRQELHAALVRAALRPRWVDVRRGARWWVYQLKAALGRAPRFSFPMVIAQKTTPVKRVLR
jgi:SAM-dependent methyltransferase